MRRRMDEEGKSQQEAELREILMPGNVVRASGQSRELTRQLPRAGHAVIASAEGAGGRSPSSHCGVVEGLVQGRFCLFQIITNVLENLTGCIVLAR